ncbi:MAG: glycosyltransferase family 2 protein, partial [Nitrososphaerota archaeon]|nr:glycosyltransferase family 2 protein [Nitrososphaerota archaeon]
MESPESKTVVKPLPISVVVPVKNMERTIGACLSSIKENHPFEIIVVDGDSSDLSREISRNFADKIASDHGKGPGYAHQLGAEIASQEFVAYVDADILLPPGTLGTMLHELQHYGYANIQANWSSARSATYWERAAEWHISTHRIGQTGGLSACLLRRDVIIDVCFDLALMGAGDDFDFLSRLRKKGYKTGNSIVTVYHAHRSTMRSL